MNDDYFEQFNALIDTAESYASSIGMSRGLVNKELRRMGTDRDGCTAEQRAQALAVVKEKYLAMLMLDGANMTRFREMKEDMDLDYAKGQDTYPTTRNGVLRLLNSKNNTVVKGPVVPRHESPGEDNMVFAQSSDCRKCFRCKKPGHIAKDCTKPAPSQEQMYTMVQGDGTARELDHGGESVSGEEVAEVDDEDAAYFFGQHSSGISSGLSRDWLLLDSQSSTDMFCNRRYLKTSGRHPTQ
jgi:hypothetical protein